MALHKLYITLLLIILCIPNTQSAITNNKSTAEIISTNIGANTENRCALRDKYGFIWIGTTSGLSCFDGNGVPVYRNNSGVLHFTSNLLISTIFEDGEDIWFGCNTGLYIFNRQLNEVYRFPYSTSYNVTISANVNKIIRVDNNRIWITTQGQGFFIYDSSNNTLTQENRHGSFYSDVAIGANGLIYCASLNGSIQIFSNKGQFINEISLPNYTIDKAHISLAASDSSIWITTSENIFQHRISSNKIEHINTNEDIGIINTIFAHTNSTLLIGTNTGLYCYNILHNTLSRINHFNTFNQLSGETPISALTPDSDGNVIVVQSTGSLQLMINHATAFRFINIPTTTISHNRIHAVAPIKDNTGMWIGSDNGLGLYDFKTNTYIEKQIPQLRHDAISSIAPKGSQLWIGTRNNGVILYNPTTDEAEQFLYNDNKPYTILSNDINSIYHSQKGETFILTNWGICYYDSISNNFPQITSFSQQYRGLMMQEDRHGGLWIATANNGLFYRAPNSNIFESAMWCKNIASQQISKLHLDKQGNLWVATHNEGLFKYDETEKDFFHVDIPTIKNQSISYITNDNTGTMWIGTTSSIVSLDINGHNQNINLSRFSSQIPLLTTATLLDSGSIVINGYNGFLKFEPSRLKSNDNLIKVFPRSLSFPHIDNEEEELNSPILNTLLYTKTDITLPYAYNSFTLYTSTSCPLLISGVRYDYMLRGYDKGWNLGLTTPEISYSNLPIGEYELLLRPHGIANAYTSKLTIKILPPWYLTIWAIIIYILLFLLVSWSIYRWARRKIRRNFQRKLQDLRIQKEREVFESKTRYFINLVHEIRTPLMLISLPLERLTEEMQNNAEAVRKSNSMQYIKSMQRNIDYLLGITNQLLDFRKAENNSEILLHLKNCNLSQMLRSLYLRFEEPLTICGKKITLNITDEDIILVADADKMERVLMNIIGNAMKFARTSIEINLSKNASGTITLSVSDDGPGIAQEERERIFDTYYQIGNDNVSASLGTGLGLAYAKLIANAHKGDIRVSDSAIGGAMFSITLPMLDDVNATTTLAAEYETDMQSNDLECSSNSTILLVEDNNDLSTMIKDALAQHFKVITATDGVYALDLLSTNNIDIIVSDVMMPRMDGMELCKHVKNNINFSHIPYIILTAKTGAEAHEEGLKCGADVYLEKPFPIKQLIYQINNLLRTRLQFYERMRTSTDMSIIDKAKDMPGLNRLDSEFIERMNTIITEDLADEEFSFDGLAEKLGMSRSSFYRKITAVVGMSPSDYLKNFRLNRAVELLSEGCRVTEVVYRVGFSSSSYFAKCFRDKFGMLPSDYISSIKSLRTPENGQ